MFHAPFAGNSFKAWKHWNKVSFSDLSSGPTKKNRARKNDPKKILNWPFRTTGHSRFGWGSHQRWSPTRLKKMSYMQKTVLAREKIHKNRYNSGSRPSLGMIPGAKIFILTRGKDLQSQKSLGRPADSKNRKKIKNAKIDQNRGPRRGWRGSRINPLKDQ